MWSTYFRTCSYSKRVWLRPALLSSAGIEAVVDNKIHTLFHSLMADVILRFRDFGHCQPLKENTRLASVG